MKQYCRGSHLKMQNQKIDFGIMTRKIIATATTSEAAVLINYG
jgi:hypothetical protein